MHQSSLTIDAIRRVLPNDLVERILKSRDPFILLKLAERSDGDTRKLTSQLAKIVLDKSDDDINRQDLNEMFRERYASQPGDEQAK